jgi:hypothetical protein
VPLDRGAHPDRGTLRLTARGCHPCWREMPWHAASRICATSGIDSAHRCRRTPTGQPGPAAPRDSRWRIIDRSMKAFISSEDLCVMAVGVVIVPRQPPAVSDDSTRRADEHPPGRADDSDRGRALADRGAATGARRRPRPLCRLARAGDHTCRGGPQGAASGPPGANTTLYASGVPHRRYPH